MPDQVTIQMGPTKLPVYVVMFIYGILLISGAYFIERTDFYFLLSWQILLHALYVFMYLRRKIVSLQHFIVAAILVRIAAAFVMPTLSEDVYRFIWDGQLISRGENPMLSTPDSFLTMLPVSSSSYQYFYDLHLLINHPQYFTCYPPLMQGAFWLSAAFGFNSIAASVIIIKLILAIADCATIFFLVKILKRLNLNTGFVILYALHPLVIIEGSANAHFEVMQAAFICGSIYLILIKKINVAAIFWGLAIATKLLPLLLLPLWWRYLGSKKGFWFCCISCGVVVASFLPFLSLDAIIAFSESINLFIQKFEFNASLYYIIKQMGFWITGYNEISLIGPLLLLAYSMLHIFIVFRRKIININMLGHTALLLLSMYFVFSTTVHPWYIITLLPFAIIVSGCYPFVWLSMAFLSYHAYATPVVHENPWMLLLEYGTVLFVFIIERKKNQHILADDETRQQPANEFTVY